VCDLTRVFSDYKWATQLNNELNEKRKSIETQIDQKRDAIDRVTKQLSGLNPGSEQFNVKKQNRDRLMIDLEVWRRYQEQELLHEKGPEVFSRSL